MPVTLRLQCPIWIRGSRQPVVNEHHVMTDKDSVFEGDAFANKRVTADFAFRSYLRSLLNLNKRSDPGVVADLTPVEVYEVVYPDILSQHDIVSYLP